jgi:phosphohistidine phosphatase
MTNLYLFRHGLAGDRGTYANDDQRPLTDEGQQKTRRVAKRLRELNINIDLILSSPLVRAQQTADILLDIGVGRKLEISEFLAPDGSLDRWLEWFIQWRHGVAGTLMLVGHQPDLGLWAETLLWGTAKEVIALKKAGIIGIEVPESGTVRGSCQLFWLTSPKLLL